MLAPVTCDSPSRAPLPSVPLQTTLLSTGSSAVARDGAWGCSWATLQGGGKPKDLHGQHQEPVSLVLQN